MIYGCELIKSESTLYLNRALCTNFMRINVIPFYFKKANHIISNHQFISI